MKKHGTLSLMEQVLSYSRKRDFLQLLRELLATYKDTLLSLESPLGSDYWHAVYLVGKRILEKLGYSEETAADLFAKTLDLSKTKEEIMNVTQAIKQEGLQQGMQQEKLEIAKEMLEDKMPKEQISKWTGLDLKQIEKLLQGSH